MLCTAVLLLQVPSNLYSFSYEPYPHWNYFFGRQPEIQHYLQSVAAKHHAYKFIQFYTTVIESRWMDQLKLWRITAVRTYGDLPGEQQLGHVNNASETFVYYTQFLVNAQGPLSNPQLPNIPGIDQFQGKQMHSAQWDPDYDFNNKRVVIVGTGASSIQIVPELAKNPTTHQVIIQRTAPWIVPRLDRRVTDFEKKLFTVFPSAQRLLRAIIYWAREMLVLNFVYRWPTRWVNIGLVKYFLRQQIDSKQHPDLLAKVEPNWELGCKRVLLSNDWYPALQQDNVELETDGVAEVFERGIKTKNGTVYDHIDCIVWSTGFQVQPQAKRLPISVYGRNGLLLDDNWSESVQAYKGVTLPNYPNLFFMLGYVLHFTHTYIIIVAMYYSVSYR